MLNLRQDFPLLCNYPDLVYLDNAATTQKPEVVINAVNTFYRTNYASIHRGLYELSIQSTKMYEDARAKTAEFIGSNNPQEVVFTKNATEGLNLLAHSLSKNWKAGDSIILSDQEHHSNLLPWLELAHSQGIKVKYTQQNSEGQLDINHFTSLLDDSIRVIPLSLCSNVTGTITDFIQLKKILNQEGSVALLIADASQAVAHFSITEILPSLDFVVFSGHKVYGPSGIGVLWGKEYLLKALPPYQLGGGMVTTATLEKSSWQESPLRFEAGTSNSEGAIGLATALNYLAEIGLSKITEHTIQLTTYTGEQLQAIPEVSILHTIQPESGIISFIVNDIHAHDVAQFLGDKNICIRAGHHCAAPLHQKLEIVASNRISIGIYNSQEDIDQLVATLKEIIQDISHA